jgi:hypothetical protein
VRVFGGAEGHRECDGSDWLNSFPSNPKRGFDSSLSYFWSKPILSKVATKRILA